MRMQAGAFGGGKDDEDSADEDGDIFWDAVEGPYSEPMDEDGWVRTPILSFRFFILKFLPLFFASCCIGFKWSPMTLN
jgi:hypothetical protein